MPQLNKIVCCVVCYNDYPLIKSMIESIYDKCERIIAVDGRYDDFEQINNCDCSTDGTLEYLGSLSKVELFLVPGLSEVEKRNIYIDQLEENDLVLNLDADEVLVGNIPELNSDIGIVDLIDGHTKHKNRRATRFFRYHEGMEYKNVHYMLYLNDKSMNGIHKVFEPFTHEPIKDFHIVHNDHLRSHERIFAKKKYYSKLIRKEAPYKK